MISLLVGLQTIIFFYDTLLFMFLPFSSLFIDRNCRACIVVLHFYYILLAIAYVSVLLQYVEGVHEYTKLGEARFYVSQGWVEGNASGSSESNMCFDGVE